MSTASKKAILDAHGRDNVTVIRPATKDDVEWVRDMGGHVPEDGIIRRRRQSAVCPTCQGKGRIYKGWDER